MGTTNKPTIEDLRTWAEQAKTLRTGVLPTPVFVPNSIEELQHYAGLIAREKKAKVDVLKARKFAKWEREDKRWEKKLAGTPSAFQRKEKAAAKRLAATPKRLSLLTPKQKRTRLVEYRRKFGGSVGCS